MSVVVMYDAMSVRRVTGMQSTVLNQMMEDYRKAGKEELAQEKLKEFIGHSPIQVLVGAILGICFALFYCLVVIR